MAKKEQLLRLVHIVKALEKAPEGRLSYQELYNYLKQKHEDKDCEKFSFSEKTFQRDRHLLEDIFMIYIAPNGKGRWVIDFFAPWLDRKYPNPAEPGELRYCATVAGKDVWVKDARAFVIIDGARVYDFDPDSYKPEEIVRPLARTFIPARVTDNPHLVNTGYMATLQALPEPLRSQMLHGDFSAGIAYRIIENLVFTADFRQPLNMYNPKKSERWSIAAGTEVNITDFFALQAGILLKGTNPKISFGSSLAWKKLSFNATYSLDLTSSLNPINKLSLAVKMDFGDGGRKVLQNRADKLYIEGIDYYTQGEFEKAIEKWKEVLVLFPRFDPAKQGITTAQNSIALRKKIRDVQKLY